MDRRLFLSVIAGTAALPSMLRALPIPPPQPHRLNLANPHAGETFSGIYRDDNGPIPGVMDELSVFLRDFHCGEKIAIDVGVLDFLSQVMQAVGQTKATILSAYRTPQTNAMLARSHFGVAENSQHLYGRALDVHFGEKLADAMRAARKMQRGGVGWYPHSSFMHIDSGPVRNWDLDHIGLGTLVAGNRKVRFNKRGDLLVAKADKSTTIGRGAAKVQTAVLRGSQPGTTLTGGQPVTVRGRLSLLRQIAHASLKARTGS